MKDPLQLEREILMILPSPKIMILTTAKCTLKLNYDSASKCLSSQVLSFSSAVQQILYERGASDDVRRDFSETRGKAITMMIFSLIIERSFESTMPGELTSSVPGCDYPQFRSLPLCHTVAAL
jgi:hypothetical protein